jgi:hypothetical protein
VLRSGNDVLRAQSLLRHPGLAQPGEIGGFVERADLWHPEVSAGPQAGDARPSIVGNQPTPFSRIFAVAEIQPYPAADILVMLIAAADMSGVIVPPAWRTHQLRRTAPVCRAVRAARRRSALRAARRPVRPSQRQRGVVGRIDAADCFVARSAPRNDAAQSGWNRLANSAGELGLCEPTRPVDSPLSPCGPSA